MIALTATALPAEAQTRRKQKRDSFRVALQPFSLVRDAIHAVADPIVHHAPRVVARVATAPIRVASYAARPAISRGERVDEDELYDDEPETEVNSRTRVRVAEPVDEAEPMRVAFVSRSQRAPVRDPDEDPPSPSYGAAGESDQPEKYDAESEDDAPQVASRGAKPMVAGNRAVLRNGVAYAPSNAPQRVKNAIWAANSLRHKPYVWGGGHGSFYDRGYDCSGTVSFALHGADALASPLPSSDFMRYGERGRGRWITIYSRRGHTFAMIAGLRLDTTDFQNGGNTGPSWHLDSRDTRGYVARHPAGM